MQDSGPICSSLPPFLLPQLVNKPNRVLQEYNLPTIPCASTLIHPKSTMFPASLMRSHYLVSYVKLNSFKQGLGKCFSWLSTYCANMRTSDLQHFHEIWPQCQVPVILQLAGRIQRICDLLANQSNQTRELQVQGETLSYKVRRSARETDQEYYKLAILFQRTGV